MVITHRILSSMNAQLRNFISKMQQCRKITANFAFVETCCMCCISQMHNKCVSCDINCIQLSIPHLTQYFSRLLNCVGCYLYVFHTQYHILLNTVKLCRMLFTLHFMLNSTSVSYTHLRAHET